MTKYTNCWKRRGANTPFRFTEIPEEEETSALEPLDLGPVWAGAEPPETYPSGI